MQTAQTIVNGKLSNSDWVKLASAAKLPETIWGEAWLRLRAMGEVSFSDAVVGLKQWFTDTCLSATALDPHGSPLSAA